MLDMSDFIRNKHGHKKYKFYCNSCGKDRGYLQKSRRGGIKTGKLCVQCANSGSKVIQSGGYCSYCRKKHDLPEQKTSNAHWLWESNDGLILGGTFRCKQYLKDKAARWTKNNPQERLNIQQKSSKKYRSTNRGRLRSNISSRVSGILSSRKGSTIVNISSSKLPWPIEELMSHLESNFQPGMTWENYGQWHVDHVIPDSWFKYDSIEDEGFKMSWKLNNLQPMWSKDNLKKGNRYSGGVRSQF